MQPTPMLLGLARFSLSTLAVGGNPAGILPSAWAQVIVSNLEQPSTSAYLVGKDFGGISYWRANQFTTDRQS